ncbi:ParA family protein [Elusimicrobiota bacterium]
MAKIIAVINQKGGSGKTTTCVNLGACLAELGKSVLIVDLDPQRNATLHLLGKEKALRVWGKNKSIYDVLIKDLPIEEAIFDTSLEKLKLIPSNIDLAGADMELVNMFGREKIMREKIREISESWDFILIDCSSTLGLLTLNALTCANYCLITLQAEYLALEGMVQLLSTLKLVQNRLEWPIELIGALVTFYDQRKVICRNVASKAEGFFGGSMFKTRIRDNVRLSEAPSHGKPITLYDPSCYGAQDYKNLAQEVLTNVETRSRRESVSAN